jgi:uncharacterized membrane protein (UPF0136 family)
MELRGHWRYPCKSPASLRIFPWFFLMSFAVIQVILCNLLRMNADTVLWIYIVLLLIGGLIGFFKAGSKVSLISAAVSAALLILAALPGLFQPRAAHNIEQVILAALLVVFAIRLTKTKKFMPSGLMLAATLATLILRHFIK